MGYKEAFEEIEGIVYDSIGDYGVCTISISEFNDYFETEEERSNALKTLIKRYDIKLKDYTGVKTFVDDSFTEEYIIDKEFGLTYEFHYKE